jgi:hypothetical protein
VDLDLVALEVLDPRGHRVEQLVASATFDSAAVFLTRSYSAFVGRPSP